MPRPPRRRVPATKKSSTPAVTATRATTTKTGVRDTPNTATRKTSAVGKEDSAQKANEDVEEDVRATKRRRVSCETEPDAAIVETAASSRTRRIGRNANRAEGENQTTKTTRTSKSAKPIDPTPSASPLNTTSTNVNTNQPIPSSIRVSRSVLKAQSTPGVDRSVPFLSKFKRRPRQGSILSLVQTSVLEPTDSELLGGGDLDSNLDLEAEGDFGPDAESTPLHTTTTTREPQGQKAGKRGAESFDPLYDVSPEPEAEPEQQHDDSNEDIVESQDQSSDLLPTQAAQNNAPESPEEVDPSVSSTMAPPLSSSNNSVTSSPQRPAQKAMPATKPSRAPARTRKASKTEKHLDSAALSALLPRRKFIRKQPDEYDLSDNDDNEQASEVEDASTVSPALRKSSRRTKALASKPTNKPTRKAAAPTTQHRGAKRKGDTAAPAKEIIEVDAPTKDLFQRRRSLKTYGKPVTNLSDKENESASEAESDVTTTRRTVGKTDGKRTKRAQAMSAELVAVAHKFAAVDEWEMEFESIDDSRGGGSSPWR